MGATKVNRRNFFLNNIIRGIACLHRQDKRTVERGRDRIMPMTIGDTRWNKHCECVMRNVEICRVIFHPPRWRMARTRSIEIEYVRARIADSGSDLYLDPACARVPFEWVRLINIVLSHSRLTRSAYASTLT